MSAETETQPAVSKLSRDLKKAAKTLTRTEARYLVDTYYQIQDYRKASGLQIGSIAREASKREEEPEPCEVLEWAHENMKVLEGQIKRALDAWTDEHEVGRWLKSICGIGPVISAGLLAHVDISKCPTVGHIWSFAGLDPTKKWEKGCKRPWNAAIKTLCWKIGESFVKVSSNEADIYGAVYLARKEYEQGKNERKDYTEAAKVGAARVGKTTEAYKSYIEDKLPAGHLHARAKRYAVKLFLSHFHHVWYEVYFKTAPPKPYVIEHKGHVDFIAPPNWPMVEVVKREKAA